MRKRIETLANKINTNNSWALVTTLLGISIMWVMTFRTDFGTRMYQEPLKWNLCIKLFGAFLIIYSPIILLAIFRANVVSRLSKVGYLILWASTFLGYPFMLFFTDALMTLIPVRMTSEMLPIIGIFLTCTELLSAPTSKTQTRYDFSKWRDIVSPEWIVVAVFIMVSLQGTGLTAYKLHDHNKFVIWLQHLLAMAVYYLFYLINHYLLINKVYKKRGIIYYGMSFTGLALLFYFPLALLFRYLPGLRPIMQYQLGELWVGPNAPVAFYSIFWASIFYFMIVTIPLAILVQWIRQGRRINQLQQEKTTTELNLLKQQINPHFFFNTLNNLYSMSLTKNDKTSEGIMQLSDLMRYVIYEGKNEWVSLENELKYLDDYLNLQKMRLYQNFDLKFEKSIENDTTLVPPLLFIILVENAFKHGIEGAEKDSFLYIDLSQKGNSIAFTCTNSIEEVQNRQKGLGLQNLKKRLELLFPERHKLIINQEQNKYDVHMTFDL